MTAFNEITFGLKTDDVVGFTEAQRTAISLSAYVSIVSEGTWLYRNLKFPRWKNCYGFCQVMSGAFVRQAIPIEYINQQVLFEDYTDVKQSGDIGCLIKALGEALGQTAILTVTPTRSPITSLRFRFFPGVLANLSISWSVYTPKCGETVLTPDAAEGRPPNPSNGGYNPGGRPSAQGGDPYDNSPNDGLAPEDGQSDPPKPIPGSGGVGTWKVTVSGYSFEDVFFTSTVDSEITDPGASVSATTVPTNLQPNQGGKADYRLVFLVNGVDRSQGSTGFALSAGQPFYS